MNDTTIINAIKEKLATKKDKETKKLINNLSKIFNACLYTYGKTSGINLFDSTIQNIVECLQ